VHAGVNGNTGSGCLALTTGKYLSSPLYVGYGVGLFTRSRIVTLARH
jgi:autotransporter translocation and assembly factor TamB